MVAACGDDDEDARTQIELFQFKGEAVDIFAELVADFEAEHPDIDVVLNNVPNADAAIRTRLVRDDVPDVMTLNGSGNFAQLARADVFYDFADEPVLDTVNPAIVEDPHRPRHERRGRDQRRAVRQQRRRRDLQQGPLRRARPRSHRRRGTS